MDLLTLARKLRTGGANPNTPVSPSSGNKEAAADNLGQLVKRTSARSAVKNKWGGKDYPIDVNDYQEFVSALTGMGWILRDIGYDLCYLTTNGLTYDWSNIWSHAAQFNKTSGKIVAIVASSNGTHFRITRANGKLRIRNFKEYGRAIAPVHDGMTAGTSEMSKQALKEVIKVLMRQTRLDPDDADSIVKWGRLIKNGLYRPRTATLAKSYIRNEFQKAK